MSATNWAADTVRWKTFPLASSSQTSEDKETESLVKIESSTEMTREIINECIHSIKDIISRDNGSRVTVEVDSNKGNYLVVKAKGVSNLEQILRSNQSAIRPMSVKLIDPNIKILENKKKTSSTQPKSQKETKDKEDFQRGTKLQKAPRQHSGSSQPVTPHETEDSWSVVGGTTKQTRAAVTKNKQGGTKGKDQKGRNTGTRRRNPDG